MREIRQCANGQNYNILCFVIFTLCLKLLEQLKVNVDMGKICSKEEENSTITGETSRIETRRDSDRMIVIKMHLRNVNCLGIWANGKAL
jgi:hypothetical protein